MSRKIIKSRIGLFQVRKNLIVRGVTEMKSKIVELLESNGITIPNAQEMLRKVYSKAKVRTTAKVRALNRRIKLGSP